jgi:hypothetical protein
MAVVLISGSRNMSEAMRECVAATVERIAQRGDEIVVGDNPRGVDQEVVVQAAFWGIQCTVVGIKDKPRLQIFGEVSYIQVAVHGRTVRDKWALRDQWMCRCADKGVFIWDGKSRGTIAAYNYMRDQMDWKETHLIGPKMTAEAR